MLFEVTVLYPNAVYISDDISDDTLTAEPQLSPESELSEPEIDSESQDAIESEPETQTLDVTQTYSSSELEWQELGFEASCVDSQSRLFDGSDTDLAFQRKYAKLFEEFAFGKIHIKALIWDPRVRQCPYCRALVTFVEKLGELTQVQFEFCEFAEKPAHMRPMTLPQIWIGFQYVGGWSDLQSKYS